MCRPRVDAIRCVICDEPFIQSGRRNVCSPECRLVRRRREKREAARKPENAAKQAARFRAWYERNKVRVIAKVQASRGRGSSPRMPSNDTASAAPESSDLPTNKPLENLSGYQQRLGS